MTLAALALTTYDPNSRGNFFLKVSSQSSHFTPGLVAAFLLGMFDRRATSRGAIAAILATPLLSFGSEWLYAELAGASPALSGLLGSRLNFMHRVALVFALTLVIHAVVSRLGGQARGEAERSQPYLWIHAAGSSLEANIAHASTDRLRALFRMVLVFFVFQLGLVLLVWGQMIGTSVAAMLSALFTLSLFIIHIRHDARHFYQDDRLYAGLVSAVTMFIMFYFA